MELYELADTLCNDLFHHDEKFSESNLPTDADCDRIEAERDVNGGICFECMEYAQAIMSSLHVEVA